MYRIQWDYGYGDPSPKAEWHERAWFTDDVGFTPDIEKQLDAMRPGDVLRMPVPASCVTIVCGPVTVGDGDHRRWAELMREFDDITDKMEETTNEEKDAWDELCQHRDNPKKSAHYEAEYSRAHTAMEVVRDAWREFFFGEKGKEVARLQAAFDPPTQS